MNWGIFDYAGNSALAWTALLASLTVVLVLLALFVWLLFRRKWIWAAFPLPILLVWAILWNVFAPRLDHAWFYLSMDARRAYSTYVGLTFATAFIPPSGGTGLGAFNRIVTSDLGFAKGQIVSSRVEDGHTWTVYSDEDYPDGVTALDGRTVDTGFRFRNTRRLTGLIPLFDRPTAKTARVIGAEAPLYTNILSSAGLALESADSKALVDIVYMTPASDWLVGSDSPDVAAWRRLAKGLAEGGLVALHVDARLLSRARLKGILTDFRTVFSHYRLWCTGLHDYVLTSGQGVSADEIQGLFDNEQAFDAFVAADAESPVYVFACYVGTDAEIEPGLEGIPAFGHARATWSAPALAFSGQYTNHLALVSAAALTPLDVQYPTWFGQGDFDDLIYTKLSNAIVRVQGARRELLLGFEAADAGASTNAIEHWSTAAKDNMKDPLLLGLADSLDLEGRRFLRIGNVGAAMHCYETRLLIRPEDVAAVHNFGVCLKKSGHHDMAASVFAKAVNMDPITDEHRLELVECCAASHKEDIACRQLEVLIQKNPMDPVLNLRLARLLALRTNPARDVVRSVELAEKAVRLVGGKDPAYLYALAEVYIDCGQVARGIEIKRSLKGKSMP